MLAGDMMALCSINYASATLPKNLHKWSDDSIVSS